jgi:UDP-N-acetylmuramoyl-tripeptide--D-alanyl-D-alanine ligase
LGAAEGAELKLAVLHLITSLRSGQAGFLLEHVVRADRDPHAPRQIIISLIDCGDSRHALQNVGVELHCLNVMNPFRLLSVFFRLVILLRRIRPDVVMTWLYQAHLMATLAMLMSGISPRRMVWNLSCSNPNLANTLRGRWILTVLAWLSPLPSAIATDSRSSRQVHEAAGFRPRRWLYLPWIQKKRPSQNVLKRYRQLWRTKLTGQRRLHERLWRRFPRLKIWWAQLRRATLSKTTFIAVTGSCGKTTTTHLAAAVLRTGGSCYLGAHGNVPHGSIKTVLSLPLSVQFCVQETSAHFPGAIAEHVRVLRPEIAIVTTVGTDHYTTFRSLEATAQEKGQLVERLPKHGTAILNLDDPHVRAMAAKTRAYTLTFGRSADADIRAVDISSSWPDRLTLTVVYGQASVPIQTRLVGEHWTTSVLAAIACGIACGIDLKTCAEAIEEVNPVFGRYSVHTEDGGAAYILDTRKAPFWTLESSFKFITNALAPRKTVVFGTISDIPGRGSNKYRKIARDTLQVADRVVFVGSNAASVSKLLRQEEFRERLFTFETTYKASLFLAKEVLPEELLYIKASITDHLERLMLSQMDSVVCWRERCRIHRTCQTCRNYRKPHDPPFGLPSAFEPTAEL